MLLFLQTPSEKKFFLNLLNVALNAAPTFKWGLSIVPLYGAITGKPPVENIDLNQSLCTSHPASAIFPPSQPCSLALAGTGVIWGYYALLVEPKAYMLFAVSVALTMSNGWNAYRKFRYLSSFIHASFWVLIIGFLAMTEKS